ncbi:UDP-N-acetylmuramate--L-alanine ligase [Helicovermis profundi]|uniref:UDP-N-acetylmuramate--L-alanine ligase n=1 Tax=Helicovermis profundi TaxID=3065157 RepID=A0AAU9EC91_9FIRM|nr:UDP-N-acetylmuramate--L-alanine ligase [Clostridia bacterium S502]
MLENKNLKHIHLIGIGGIGVSAIAEILHMQNYIVTGSDLNSSQITKNLENKGIKIFYKHESTNIEGADLIVYSAAVSDENVELIKAKELKLPTVGRAKMLGEILTTYKKSVAISGAHGKTTTTSMTSVILSDSNLDPTLLVGGEVKELGGNARFGHGDIIVTEACEYKDSFLNFIPTLGVILNIDEDHLDYYKNLEHIISSFIKFAQSIPKKGHLIINNDDYNAKKIIPHVNCNVITFGINIDSDIMAKNITFNDDGLPSFEVYINDEKFCDINLNIPGTHNIYNALASVAIAHFNGISGENISSSLNRFGGAKRRFDILGEYKNAKIIDDYAHHPTEIKATLSAAKKIPHNKIICVFQPHTYSRTSELLSEFSIAFKDSDELIITDIYASREKDTGKIHSQILVDLIIEEGQNAKYIKTFDEIEEYLDNIIEKNDILFTMGAGNIVNLGNKLVNK